MLSVYKKSPQCSAVRDASIDTVPPEQKQTAANDEMALWKESRWSSLHPLYRDL
jgi:hypothetical protein